MKYRDLGNTGLTVSEIGFGGWAIGGNQFGNSYGQTQDDVSLAALHKAYDLGCTFFETSDVYGHGQSETLIGQALRQWKRESVVIATKAGVDFYSSPQTATRQNFSEKHLRYALEQSLKRLGTDYIDVYQLQNPSMELIHHGKVFSLMQALKAEGKIRHVGISIHDPMEGIMAVDIGQVETVQAVYNLFDHRAERALFPHCQKLAVGLIIREPLANGFLAGKFQDSQSFEKGDIRANWPKLYLTKRIQATEQFRKVVPQAYPGLVAMALKSVLTQPAVSVVIPGCKTPQQVVENMTVSDLPDLTEAEREAIRQVSSTLV